MSVIFYLNEVFKEWYYRSVKQFTNAASKLTFEYSRSLLFVFCSYFRFFVHQSWRAYKIKLIKKLIYSRSLCTSIPIYLEVLRFARGLLTFSSLNQEQHHMNLCPVFLCSRYCKMFARANSFFNEPFYFQFIFLHI